jgi:hypothetical protein
MSQEQTEHLVRTNQSLAADSLQRGELYTYRETFTLGDGENLNVIMALDSESIKQMRVVNRSLAADSGVTGTITMNADIDTSGTGFPATGNLINDTVTNVPSDVTVESGGTYSGGTETIPIRVADSNAPAGPQTSLPAFFRVEAGNSILYELTSQAASNDVVLQFVVGLRDE